MDKMTAEQALRSTLIEILIATRGESEGHTADTILAALSAPRVPEAWRDFVAEVVESAEGYERRSGNKVNGDWVARDRALLAASPEPVAPSVPDASVNDAAMFGTGFFRVNPDGSTDHIPPQNVHIAISEDAQNAERCPECGMLDGHAEGCLDQWIDIPANLRRQSNTEQHAQQLISDLRAEVEALKETRVMVPYLKNRADAVDGHYCIARLHPHGYHEFWNKEQKEWCSAGSVFELGKIDPDAARLREGGSGE